MAMAPSPDTLPNLRRYLHDLAQPLAAITGLVDLLLQELPEGNPLSRELRTISEQLEVVLQIIAEIRRLALGDSGAQMVGRRAAAPPEK